MLCGGANSVKGWLSAVPLALALLTSTALGDTVLNGSFETGSLAGWTVSHPSLVQVVTSASNVSGGSPAVWTATDGQYFAYLSAGAGAGVYTMLSQQFTVSETLPLSFDVFFNGGDYVPYNDRAYVKLISVPSGESTLLYSKSIADLGNYGSDGWNTISASVGPGTYQFEVGVENTADNSQPSFVGIDHVQVAALEPAAVPLPAAVYAGFALLGALVAVRQFRQHGT